MILQATVKHAVKQYFNVSSFQMLFDKITMQKVIHFAVDAGF
jgi:hypothetical protein